MSDLPLTDDELLSSALDGELAPGDQATLDERLRVEPELAQRFAAMRKAQELAATPVVPLSPADADRILAAALTASATTTSVTDLAAARQKRSWRNRAIAIAAGAAVVVIAIPTLLSLNGDDDANDVATEAPADEVFDAEMATVDATPSDDYAEMPAEAAGDIPAEEADMPAAEPEETSEGRDVRRLRQPELFKANLASLADPLLGTYDSIEGLRLAASSAFQLRDEDETESDPTAAASENADTLLYAYERLASFGFGHCPDLVDDLDDTDFGGAVIGAEYAEANVGDERFLVGLIELADGTTTLVTVSAETCGIVTAPVP